MSNPWRQSLACWLSCALALAGCALPSWLRSETGQSVVEEASITTVEVAPSVIVSAFPSYRLIVSRQLIDAPSRLLVLHTHIETLGNDSLRFDPSNVRFILPDGTLARVFEHARAVELVRRADLGAADLSYRHTMRFPSLGGLPQAAKGRLREGVVGNLLRETVLNSGQALQGYLVVDTGRPLESLDGAVLEVTANRVSDAAAARDSYRFFTSTAVTERPSGKP